MGVPLHCAFEKTFIVADAPFVQAIFPHVEVPIDVHEEYEEKLMNFA